jgi:hypothetical protein
VYVHDCEGPSHREKTAKHGITALGLSHGHISRDTFPLPITGSLLRAQSKELHFGRGFFVLRGLRVDSYSREENIIIYAGVSTYVGDVRGRQQDQRHTNGTSLVLSHIKDLSNTTEKGSIGAPSNTNDKQVFHTDSGDIVSLFCLNPAASGGESKISSSWNVYNILAKERPDLIHTLSEDWVVDGYGCLLSILEGKVADSSSFNDPNHPFTKRPLLYHQKATASTPERIVIQYARRYFTGFLAQPRSKNIPPITEAQAEALDALHFTAEKHSASLDFQKGDVQYINNLSVFHSRNGFTDEPGKERHLLRLWLRDSEYAWETPTPLHGRWDAVYGSLSPEEQVFTLEPQIRRTVGR